MKFNHVGIFGCAEVDCRTINAPYSVETTMAFILVATDGSEGANRGIDYAAQEAKAEGAELLIVHVMRGCGVPDNVFRQFSRAEQVWLREPLESASKPILNVARERARGVGVATIFLESRAGDVANTIIEIAQEKNVENIVVGKRGSDVSRPCCSAASHRKS